MKGSPKLVWTLLVIGFASRGPTPSRAELGSAAATLQLVQDRYRRIDTFSADFRQVYSGHNVRQEESGILFMKKPAKMYWEYQKPRSKLFVANGSKTYFYLPADHQVVESDLRLDTTQTPLLFLFGQADVEREFAVAYSEEPPAREGNVVVRLVPRQPRGDFSEVLLEIDPDAHLIERLRVVEPIGNYNDYFLSDFRENVKVSDKRFEFRIPPGTEVIVQ